MNKEQVLQDCTVEGNVVRLPDTQLDRKLYQEVAKTLELIGGKWDRKASGFTFKTNPQDLLDRVLNEGNVNLKKEFQFFETPPELADRLVELALEKHTVIASNTWDSAFGVQKILEPSAGQGAIIEAIRRKIGICTVYAYELMDTNREILKDKFGGKYFLLSSEKDFLQSKDSIYFNWIIANPPFSKNQDIDHVYKMYSILKDNGVMVSITSKHWEMSSNKKETEFRDWLDKVGAEIHDIDQGSFKSSGTLVGGKILVITKNNPY